MFSGRDSLRWRVWVLGVLLLLALGVHIFRAVQEPVVNPDAIRFIEQAEWLGVDPVGALKGEIYHPLHAAAALLAHAGTRFFFRDDRVAWIGAIKVVGILAGSVVVLEIVALGRLVGAPFWYAVGAGVLWIFGRRTSTFGADGLSDMLCLALFAGGMIAAFHGLRFRKRILPLFFVAGLLAGLAYLTRPEGAAGVVIVLGTLAVMALRRGRGGGGRARRRGMRFKVLPRRGISVRTAMGAGMVMLLGFAIPAGPYMAVTHSVSNKEAKFLAPAAAADSPAFDPDAGDHHWRPVKVGMEIVEGFGETPLAILLVGMVLAGGLWGRARLRFAVLLWMGLWVGVMFAVIYRLHYLDVRHTLVLVLLLHVLFGLALVAWKRPVVWAMRYLGERMGRAVGARRESMLAGCFVGVVFLIAVVPGIVKLRIPPRDDKRYLNEAAKWVAEHTKTDTVVAEAQRLVGYYSGRPYARWWGSPKNPRVEDLAVLRTAEHPHVVAVFLYLPELGDLPRGNIGPYVEIARFGTVHDVLVLYALPGDAVMAGR